MNKFKIKSKDYGFIEKNQILDVHISKVEREQVKNRQAPMIRDYEWHSVRLTIKSTTKHVNILDNVKTYFWIDCKYNWENGEIETLEINDYYATKNQIKFYNEHYEDIENLIYNYIEERKIK